MTNERTKLIDTILELAGDEIETQDLIKISKESISELIDRLINIAFYYSNNL